MSTHEGNWHAAWTEERERAEKAETRVQAFEWVGRAIQEACQEGLLASEQYLQCLVDLDNLMRTTDSVPAHQDSETLVDQASGEARAPDVAKQDPGNGANATPSPPAEARESRGAITPGINPGVRVRLKETNAVGATAIVDGWLSDKLVRIVWEWNGHRSEVEADRLVIVHDPRPSDATVCICGPADVCSVCRAAKATAAGIAQRPNDAPRIVHSGKPFVPDICPIPAVETAIVANGEAIGPNGTTYRVIDGKLHRVVGDLPPALRVDKVHTGDEYELHRAAEKYAERFDGKGSAPEECRSLLEAARAFDARTDYPLSEVLGVLRRIAKYSTDPLVAADAATAVRQVEQRTAKAASK